MLRSGLDECWLVLEMEDMRLLEWETPFIRSVVHYSYTETEEMYIRIWKLNLVRMFW